MEVDESPLVTTGPASHPLSCDVFVRVSLLRATTERRATEIGGEMELKPLQH